MLGTVARKLFGSRNDRLIKGYTNLVQKINAMEDGLTSLKDVDLQNKTTEFRERLQNGEKLEAILPEAFAVVREASKRVLGMRHYDVQLIGAMVLNDGKISEMRTGEGKTLVATLAAYLNALPGQGVHVITVNDYLAKRDAEWMSKLYGFLGLTTGVVVNGLSHDERQKAYAADITYGTNNEFGFDYLRDNMAFQLAERVQRTLSYAIVDEVDSILIDEARTPLIISGPTQDSSDLYQKLDKIVPRLEKQEIAEGQDEKDASEEGDGHYTVDEKSRQVYLTENGMEQAELYLEEAGILPEGSSLFDTANISILHHLNAALRAHTLFQINVDYIVQGDEVVIVDEFTGRTMPGRRWSDGLHQAVEAKEHVHIHPENQTLASITFQNYFRLYEKLSGMTGTADTEAFELQEIYSLEVVVIPTHRPMVRLDGNDLVYMTQEEKFEAIAENIKEKREIGSPILVGTASIETSEVLSKLLEKMDIPHEVLNAKQHEREAHIIENAGRAGVVTIATNMAGRGTDIVLGGSVDAEIKALGEDASEEEQKAVRDAWQKRHDDILAAGGLHIIGTERHESRRVDNQLRGRSGRQGDPGSSIFFLSLEDNLMRIFASERVKAIMQRLGMERGQAIEHKMVSKSIENAQRKVEAHNFDIRKHLLEYDDVANDQRKVVYAQRTDLLEAEDIKETIDSLREDVIDSFISRYIPPESLDEQWDIAGLTEALKEDFGMSLDVQQWLDDDDNMAEDDVREKIQGAVKTLFDEKEEIISSDSMRIFERDVMLHVLDTEWKDHLSNMDHLRQSVGLRGYAQKNPKQEYKREGFDLFTALLDRVKFNVVQMIAQVEINNPSELEMEAPDQEMEFLHPDSSGEMDSGLDLNPQAMNEFSQEDAQTPFQRDQPKVGRNEPCPCGSGKKYKQCHGRL